MSCVPPLKGNIQNRLLLGRWQARSHRGPPVAVADALRITPGVITSSHNPVLVRAMTLEAMRAASKGEGVYDTPAAATAAAAVPAATVAAATAVAVAVVVAVVEEVAPRGTQKMKMDRVYEKSTVQAREREVRRKKFAFVVPFQRAVAAATGIQSLWKQDERHDKRQRMTTEGARVLVGTRQRRELCQLAVFRQVPCRPL